MIKCPVTGKPVPTGLGMDSESFRSARLEEHRVDCPHCGQVHTWRKEDAYLDYEGPPGGPSSEIGGHS